MASILRPHQRTKNTITLPPLAETEYNAVFLLVHKAILRYKRDKRRRHLPATKYILLSNANYWKLVQWQQKEPVIHGYSILGSYQLRNGDCYLCYW